MAPRSSATAALAELALSTFEETGDITGKARACYGLSYVFSFKGDYLNTEKYGTLALQYFEEAADHRGMINSLNVLSYVARQKQDLEKARALYPGIITILNDFTPPFKPDNGILYYGKVVIPVIFILTIILILLLINQTKLTEAYKKY